MTSDSELTWRVLHSDSASGAIFSLSDSRVTTLASLVSSLASLVLEQVTGLGRVTSATAATVDVVRATNREQHTTT